MCISNKANLEGHCKENLNITPSNSDAVEGEVVSSKPTHIVYFENGAVQVLFEDGHLEDVGIVFSEKADDNAQITG